MKKYLFLLLSFFISLHICGQKLYKLQSPDGNIQVSVSLSDKIYYDAIYQQDTLLKRCNLQMKLSNQQLGNNPSRAGISQTWADESLKHIVPLEYSTVSNKYNQLSLKSKGDYSVEFRTFNNGVAYSFITNKTNNQMQQREFELNLNFLKEGKTYRMTSFEDGVNAN